MNVKRALRIVNWSQVTANTRPGHQKKPNILSQLAFYKQNNLVVQQKALRTCENIEPSISKTRFCSCLFSSCKLSLENPPKTNGWFTWKWGPPQNWKGDSPGIVPIEPRATKQKNTPLTFQMSHPDWIIRILTSNGLYVYESPHIKNPNETIPIHRCAVLHPPKNPPKNPATKRVPSVTPTGDAARRGDAWLKWLRGWWWISCGLGLEAGGHTVNGLDVSKKTL